MLTDTERMSGKDHATRTLVALAAAVVVFVGVWAGRGFLAPLVLGAVVVVIAHPLRFPLERRGWPRWAATTVVIVAGWVILAGIIGLVAFGVVRFGSMIADYQDELAAKLSDAQGWLDSAGLGGTTTDAVTRAFDPATLLSLARRIGSSAMAISGALFFVFAYVLFMAVDGAHYARSRTYFGHERGAAIDRAGRLTAGVRRYYVVNATFGAIVAVLDGIALWLLGVPGAVVWAILAFVTNFIPNVGFVIGLVPPAMLALVVGGWPLMLAVIAVYCAVNVVLQVFVQPKFVSDAVDLSLTLSFASVAFWSLVLGPLGAVLSIPLTLLVRALILEPDPSSGWLRWLSGDRSASERDVSSDGAPTS
ncbi:AI-2E family transporter [Cellulomonas sp. HZM]|uniref:AI-2E family transporter n=1 Tax=Cellulomonas sp. HZM TaxID=1454010 RepID=UPI000AA6B9A7|nr:AI-2E family transporter [Cellulomonas sp. HZM]